MSAFLQLDISVVGALHTAGSPLGKRGESTLSFDCSTLQAYFQDVWITNKNVIGKLGRQRVLFWDPGGPRP